MSRRSMVEAFNLEKMIVLCPHTQNVEQRGLHLYVTVFVVEGTLILVKSPKYVNCFASYIYVSSWLVIFPTGSTVE